MEVPAEECQGLPCTIHPLLTHRPHHVIQIVCSQDERRGLPRMCQQTSISKSGLAICKSLHLYRWPFCPWQPHTRDASVELLIGWSGCRDLPSRGTPASPRIYWAVERRWLPPLCLETLTAPFGETWWPRTSITGYTNWHLAGFTISPCSCKCRNIWRRCNWCSSVENLVTRISSKYTNTNSKSSSTESIRHWIICANAFGSKRHLQDLKQAKQGDNSSFGHIPWKHWHLVAGTAPSPLSKKLLPWRGGKKNPEYAEEGSDPVW